MEILVTESKYCKAPCDMSMATYLDLSRLTRLASTIGSIEVSDLRLVGWTVLRSKPDHVGYSQAALGM